MRYCFSLICLFLLFVAPACGGNGGTKKIKTGPMPAGASWSGNYFTNWGNMDLVQTGASVVGTFGERNGHLEGTANGNVLVFHFSEDQRSSITSKKKKVSGSGVLKYFVVDAGTKGDIAEHRVEGTWGYGAKNSGAGIWKGYKSKKDVKQEERHQLITKGAAVKSTQPTAGGGNDYLPPPSPEDKESLDEDYDDLPEPE
ncbi:MAG: hypothetical protein ABIJ56_05300 [Pseudomonadota bacterium]